MRTVSGLSPSAVEVILLLTFIDGAKKVAR